MTLYHIFQSTLNCGQNKNIENNKLVQDFLIN